MLLSQLLGLPAVLVILWLVAASLSALLLSSHGLHLCVFPFLSLIRTLVIGFQTHPNPG